MIPEGLSPAEVQDWLTDRAEAMAAEFADGLVTVMTPALEEYVASLTAAGDPATLDGVERRFGDRVAAFTQRLSTVFLGAAAHVPVSAPARVSEQLRLALFVPDVNERLSVYEPLASNRIKGATAGMWAEIRQSIGQSLYAGQPIPEVAENVATITSFAESRATAIARTETIGAYSAGDMAGARALGDLGPDRKQWLATLDTRTRAEHAEADGQMVALEEPFLVGGESLDRPVDPAGSPENVINCRCTLLYHYADED